MQDVFLKCLGLPFSQGAGSSPVQEEEWVHDGQLGLEASVCLGRQQHGLGMALS